MPSIRTSASSPDFETVLADPDIALVVLATPDALHAPQATAALNAGKAVVVDKPFATSLADAEALVALARDKGLLLSVFQNRRWDADFLALQGEIASGRLGDIVTVESRYDRHRPLVRDRWRENDGDGVWFDLGPASGRPDPDPVRPPARRDLRHGDPAPRRPDPRLGPRRAALFRQAGRAQRRHDRRRLRRPLHRPWDERQLAQVRPRRAGRPVEIGHDRRAPGWGVDPRPATFVDGETFDRTPASGPAGDYPAYYSAMARALRGQGPNPVTPEQALSVMQVLDAGLRSSRDHREITL
jgi:predicted dehydrogenase